MDAPDPTGMALAAYTHVESLIQQARRAEATSARRSLLRLALDAVMHPTLKPYRDDPLLPLGDRYLSLDAIVGGLRNAVANAASDGMELGSVGVTLYLPGRYEAIVGRVRVAYLAPQSGSVGMDRWPEPEAVQPVSADILESARNAFAAALHTLLYVVPDANSLPPVPGPLYFAVEVPETDKEVVEVTSGESLGLPLALAFLSALSGLPIPDSIGATGAIRKDGTVGEVGYVREKQAAYKANTSDTARFLTPDTVTSLVAAAALVDSELWQNRFGREDKAPIASPAMIEGTPIFLYAEIENATTLWQNEKAAMRVAFQSYEKIVRSAIEGQSGEIFIERSGAGEGFAAAFASADTACLAAIAVERGIRAALWPNELRGTLPVRIGIHQGDAERLPRGGWQGAGPSQVARIASAASGGQILATAGVQSAILHSDSLRWTPLGMHRLRDLSEPIFLWQIGADGLLDDFAPPQSLDGLRHNLPIYDTPLVGRENELVELSHLLETKRLVTLHGLGGIGKTRLALMTAAITLTAPTGNPFPGGAFFVSLDASHEGEVSLITAVAEAVGIPISEKAIADGFEETIQFVLNALSAQRILLVLDNAESTMTTVKSFVKRMITNTTTVSILVTSRVALHVSGEKRVAVKPLAFPPTDILDEAAWYESPAVQLFLARARAVDERFAVTAEKDRHIITRLCEQLDGLPLALELAAARTRQLSLEEIETRLGESLRLLASRHPDVPEKHKTLTGTLEWAYEALSEYGQELLRNASVFAGSFSAEAVEAVMGDDADTLDLLDELEELSLVIRRRDVGGPPRFSLLRTISDFASQKLADSGNEDRIRALHANYFVRFVRLHGGRRITRSTEEATAFDALDREMPNLRSVWSYWESTKNSTTLATFVSDLSDFLRRRGHSRERLLWPQIVLRYVTGISKVPLDVRERLHHMYALALKDAGKVEAAEAETLAMLADAETLGNTDMIADALALRGVTSTLMKRFADAEQFLDQALPLYVQTENGRGEGTISSYRAYNALKLGEDDRARRLYEEALLLHRRADDNHGAAYAQLNLAYLAQKREDYISARQYYGLHLTYLRERRDTYGTGVTLFNLGEAILYTAESGEVTDAGLALLVAGEEILTRLSHKYARQARLDVERWAERLGGVTRVRVDALRRDYERRSLEYLRNITPPESTYAMLPPPLRIRMDKESSVSLT